jgi:hypothetical protein
MSFACGPESHDGVTVDHRVGCVAVYRGPQRNCLAGIKDDPDCLFFAPGHWVGDAWLVTPAALLAAERLAAQARRIAPITAAQ